MIEVLGLRCDFFPLVKYDIVAIIIIQVILLLIIKTFINVIRYKSIFHKALITT